MSPEDQPLQRGPEYIPEAHALDEAEVARKDWQRLLDRSAEIIDQLGRPVSEESPWLVALWEDDTPNDHMSIVLLRQREEQDYILRVRSSIYNYEHEYRYSGDEELLIMCDNSVRELIENDIRSIGQEVNEDTIEQQVNMHVSSLLTSAPVPLPEEMPKVEKKFNEADVESSELHERSKVAQASHDADLVAYLEIVFTGDTIRVDIKRAELLREYDIAQLLNEIQETYGLTDAETRATLEQCIENVKKAHSLK